MTKHERRRRRWLPRGGSLACPRIDPAASSRAAKPRGRRRPARWSRLGPLLLPLLGAIRPCAHHQAGPSGLVGWSSLRPSRGRLEISAARRGDVPLASPGESASALPVSGWRSPAGAFSPSAVPLPPGLERLVLGRCPGGGACALSGGSTPWPLGWRARAAPAGSGPAARVALCPRITPATRPSAPLRPGPCRNNRGWAGTARRGLRPVNGAGRLLSRVAIRASDRDCSGCPPPPPRPRRLALGALPAFRLWWLGLLRSGRAPSGAVISRPPLSAAGHGAAAPCWPIVYLLSAGSPRSWCCPRLAWGLVLVGLRVACAPAQALPIALPAPLFPDEPGGLWRACCRGPCGAAVAGAVVAAGWPPLSWCSPSAPARHPVPLLCAASGAASPHRSACPVIPQHLLAPMTTSSPVPRSQAVGGSAAAAQIPSWRGSAATGAALPAAAGPPFLYALCGGVPLGAAPLSAPLLRGLVACPPSPPGGLRCPRPPGCRGPAAVAPRRGASWPRLRGDVGGRPAASSRPRLGAAAARPPALSSALSGRSLALAGDRASLHVVARGWPRCCWRLPPLRAPLAAGDLQPALPGWADLPSGSMTVAPWPLVPLPIVGLRGLREQLLQGFPFRDPPRIDAAPGRLSPHALPPRGGAETGPPLRWTPAH